MDCALLNQCLPIYVTHWFYAVQYNKCVIISQERTAYITADQRVNRAPQNSSRVVAETQLAIFMKGDYLICRVILCLDRYIQN
jgi:hypothetical protein